MVNLFYNPKLKTDNLLNRYQLVQHFGGQVSIAAEPAKVEVNGETWYPVEAEIKFPDDFDPETMHLTGKTEVVKISGKYYQRYIVEVIPTDELRETRYRNLRQQRDELIAQTDSMVVTDSPLSEENLDIVKTYRQALRDVPEVVEDLEKKGTLDWRNIPWPEVPEIVRKWIS